MRRAAWALACLLLVGSAAQARPKIEAAKSTLAKQHLLDLASEPTPVSPIRGRASALKMMGEKKRKLLTLDQRKGLAIAAVKKEIGPSALGKHPLVSVFAGSTDRLQNPDLHRFTKEGLLTIYTKRELDPKAGFFKRFLARHFSSSNKVTQVEVNAVTGETRVGEQLRRAPQFKFLRLFARIPALQLYRDLKNNPTEFAQIKTSGTAFVAALTAGALHLNPIVVGGAAALFARNVISAVRTASAEESAVRSAAMDVAFNQAKQLEARGKTPGLSDIQMLYEAQLKDTGTYACGFGTFYKELRLREVTDAASSLTANATGKTPR